MSGFSVQTISVIIKVVLLIKGSVGGTGKHVLSVGNSYPVLLRKTLVFKSFRRCQPIVQLVTKVSFQGRNWLLLSSPRIRRGYTAIPGEFLLDSPVIYEKLAGRWRGEVASTSQSMRKRGEKEYVPGSKPHRVPGLLLGDL